MFSHCSDAKVTAHHLGCLLFNIGQTFDNFKLVQVAVRIQQMPKFEH